MAAVRCKQSKIRFFWGALRGKKWREEELFQPEASVQGQANQMLQQFTSGPQVGGMVFLFANFWCVNAIGYLAV